MKQKYGLAIDFGTSSVRAALISPEECKVVARSECANRLNAFGPDILTRITACAENEKKREAVYNAASSTLSDVLAALSEKSTICAAEVSLSVIAANTTHMYLLLHEDPGCIAKPPYDIPIHDPGVLRQEEHFLPLPGAVYFVPCAANYLGGDVLCSLLALKEKGASFLSPGEALLDLGINAEFIVPGKDGVLYCGSCAAGSALGTEKSGLSPSELTKAVADLYRGGLINRRGRLQKGSDPRIREVLREGASRPQSVIEYSGKPLWQADIALFMQSKASVATMLDYMLEIAGLDIDELHTVYLTGQLGCAIDHGEAVCTGLLPSLPNGSWTKEKDTVLSGAAAILSSSADGALSGNAPFPDDLSLQNILPDAADLYQRLRYVQLKEVEDYMELMIPHLMLPPLV